MKCQTSSTVLNICSSLLIPLSTFSRKPAYDAVGVTFPESDSGKQLEIIWTIKWIRILVVSEHN